MAVYKTVSHNVWLTHVLTGRDGSYTWPQFCHNSIQLYNTHSSNITQSLGWLLGGMAGAALSSIRHVARKESRWIEVCSIKDIPSPTWNHGHDVYPRPHILCTHCCSVHSIAAKRKQNKTSAVCARRKWVWGARVFFFWGGEGRARL